MAIVLQKRFEFLEIFLVLHHQIIQDADLVGIIFTGLLGGCP